MKYSVYDLKELDPGQIVEVHLSAPANVRLMNTENFERYRSGQIHKYIGGRVTTSPYRIMIPRRDHWHLTIDLGGHPGACKHSVQILWGHLPDAPTEPTQMTSPASTALPGFGAPTRTSHQTQTEMIVPHMQAETMRMPTQVREFDVFIAYAADDREKVALPLAKALGRKGYKVRYKEFAIDPDTNLRKALASGLHRGRVGLLAISRALVATARSSYEICYMLEKTGPGGNLIPVWHDITKQEVFDYSHLIAGFPARNTATETFSEIAEEVAKSL